MSGSITPLERLLIITARKYLVENAKIAEEEMTPSLLPFTAQDALVAESNPWSEPWLYAKIFNDYRRAQKTSPDFFEFQKALLSLIKKNYVKMEWADRYRLNVESSRFVK